MSFPAREVAAGLVALAAIALPPWTMLKGSADPAPRVLTLTGVQKDGVWTDEVVDGTTYWRKTFKAARPVLKVGEEVLLRLASADVRHGFYAPELGLGPVQIDPGQVVELRFRPSQTGEFGYWCTEVCGHCHYRMKGTLRVVEPSGQREGGDEPAPCPHAGAAAARAPRLSEEPESDAAKRDDLTTRGEELFRLKNCGSCHGERGSGGVRNPNYLADTVPQNNLLAEKMGLFEPEEAQAAIALLESRADLDALRERPPFRSYPQFLAQLKAVRTLILDGNRAGKKDPQRFQPPMSMPAWRHHLNEEEVDALIAYLLSQYPWEDAEE